MNGTVADDAVGVSGAYTVIVVVVIVVVVVVVVVVAAVVSMDAAVVDAVSVGAYSILVLASKEDWSTGAGVATAVHVVLDYVNDSEDDIVMVELQLLSTHMLVMLFKNLANTISSQCQSVQMKLNEKHMIRCS